MSSISERMRLTIEEQKFSIKQASEKADIPYRSLQNYLNGQLPGTDALVKFREAFNVDLNWLVAGDEGSDATTKVKTNRINEMLLHQVINQLERSIPSYFSDIKTHAVLRIFPLIYNSVCDISDEEIQRQSIKGVVGIYLAGLQDDFAKSSLQASEEAMTEEEKAALVELANSAQKGKDKILKKHGLPPQTESVITQHISGTGNHVAGRDIVKKDRE